MIHGFEDITAVLSKDELELVPLFVHGFQWRIGAVNAITSPEIITNLWSKKAIRVTGARVRKIVNYIRMKGLVANLIATSEGYYVENDPVKLKEYVGSLKARAKAINAVADSYLI